MEPAAVLVTGICALFDMYFLAVFRSFSDLPLTSFAGGEGAQVLLQVETKISVSANESVAYYSV